MVWFHPASDLLPISSQALSLFRGGFFLPTPLCGMEFLSLLPCPGEPRSRCVVLTDATYNRIEGKLLRQFYIMET